MKNIIEFIILVIIIVAMIVVGNLSYNNYANKKAEAMASVREAVISKYSTVSSDEEVVVEPIYYNYDKETGCEVRIVEKDEYHKTIFVNMHYETIEEMGYDKTVNYIKAFSNMPNVIYILVSCNPETRDYVYYQDSHVTILSLYSNTNYSGSLYGDNYSHPGFITFYTECNK